MHRRPTVLFLVALLATLVACSSGGGDASPATTDASQPTAPTSTTARGEGPTETTEAVAAGPEATFVAAANEICARINQDIDLALADLFTTQEPSPEKQQAGLDAIVDGTRRQADEIEALDVPPGLQDDVNAMLAAVRSGADQVEAAGIAFFQTSENPFAEAGDRALDLGLTSCNGSE